MCDEANPHYYVMLTELFEGHEWITNNVKPLIVDQKKVIPETAWSIDPFGHSPTIPYFNFLSGLHAGILNRVHYRIKKEFAKNNLLEFYYKPLLHPFVGSNSEPEIFMHMFPFFAYDIPHTCGPDPKVCAVYEFSKTVTFWADHPEAINNNNIQQKASTLVDQFKKKATLYKSKKHVLVSLGDDFLYASDDQWTKLTENHLKLHNYINTHPELRTQVQFVNLSDYLEVAKNIDVQYPSLRGDFFSYADKDDEYWTGYFTSRAFWKQFSRVVESLLRETEILHSLVLNSAFGDPDSQLFKEIFLKIVNSRRAVSVFQHHDGITGTSTNFVVQDYGQMLHTAKLDLIECTGKLLAMALRNGDEIAQLSHFQQNPEKNSIPNPQILQVPESLNIRIPIILHNSLGQEREEVVSISVNSPYVDILNFNGNRVPIQLNPVFVNTFDTEKEHFQVFFVANLPALGAVTYFLERNEQKLDERPEIMPEITIISSQKAPKKGASLFWDTMTHYSFGFTQDLLQLSNSRISVKFHPNSGLMQHVTVKGKQYDLKEDHLIYSDRRSGSYLFMPEGEATSIRTSSKTAKIIRIISGPIISEFITEENEGISIQSRKIRLYSSPAILGDQSVDPILVFTQVHHTIDYTDLIARFQTNIESEQQFFTDLNGFQFIERRRRPSTTIQGNYYPSTSTVFLQQQNSQVLKRFSVMTKQAMSVSSLAPGQLEFMIDRRVPSDDGRGLGQGAADTLPILIPMAFLFESLEYPKFGDRYYSSPSAASHVISNLLNYPVNIYFASSTVKMASKFTPVNPFPLDIHVVTMKAKKMSENKLSNREFILHLTRYAFDPVLTSISHQNLDSVLSTELTEAFSCFGIQSTSEHSLTLLYNKNNPSTLVTLKPFDLKTFVIQTVPGNDHWCRNLDQSLVENSPPAKVPDSNSNNAGSVDVQNVISGNRGSKGVRSGEVTMLLVVLLVMSGIGIWLGYKQHKVGFIFIFFAGLNIVIHLLLYHFLSD